MRGLALADRILSGEPARDALRGRGGQAPRGGRRGGRAPRTRPRSRRRPSAAPRSPSPTRLAAPDLDEHVLADARPGGGLGVPEPAHALRQAPRPARQLLEAEGSGRPEARGARAGHREGAGRPAGSRRARCTATSRRSPTATRCASRCRAAGEACFTFPRQVAGERLCLSDFVHPGGRGRARTRRALHHDGGRGRARPRRGAEERGRVPALPRAAGAGRRDGRGRGRVAAPAAARAVGLPGSAGDDDERPLPGRATAASATASAIPACPELADQATLFRLLDGRKIGVELTEGFMMDPEASVSALVLHHPQARYFAV